MPKQILDTPFSASNGGKQDKVNYAVSEREDNCNRFDNVNKDYGLYWDVLGCDWDLLSCNGVY